MRLKLNSNRHHGDFVPAVGWTAQNDIVSFSDDKTAARWKGNLEQVVKLCDVDYYATDLHFSPVRRSDVLAVGASDGTLKLVTLAGRVDKSVEAHRGAVTVVRWNRDATSILTAGEDGQVRVWSSALAPRSVLEKPDEPQPVFAVAWAPDSDSVVWATGGFLTIKSAQAAKKLMWQAHEAAIVALDWNAVNDLIVSAGEDCRYKVWDKFGQPLFASAPWEAGVVTSVAWSPDGDMFAAGAFNNLRLCDRTGWTHSGHELDCGSVHSLVWTADGTQLAAGGGNGSVLSASLIEREFEWERFQVRLDDERRVCVQDVFVDKPDVLVMEDRVIKMSLNHGMLLVTTPSRCLVYDIQNNTNTPAIFELRDPATFVIQAQKVFVLVDNMNGIQIYDYDGKKLCNPKFEGLRPEFLNSRLVDVSNEVLAVVARSSPRTIRLFETANGKRLGELSHPVDIDMVRLEQTGPLPERKIAILDISHDLHLTYCSHQRNEVVKLAGLVDSVAWGSGVLAGIVDERFSVWYSPEVAFFDRDLLSRSRSAAASATEVGKQASILSFNGSRATVRRLDGALLAINVSSYAATLSQLAASRQWDHAMRLCRFVKEDFMWACLAGYALKAMQLDTAELAYAYLEEIDKLEFLAELRELQPPVRQEAEILLLRRRVQEAEELLLQHKLVYRAIKMHIRRFDFERALAVASKHREPLNLIVVVVCYRIRYLGRFGLAETNSKFAQYAQKIPQPLEWDKVKQRCRQAKAAEGSAGSAQPAPS
eukprot:gnl/Spiro4/24517_TR12154_c0_g1_i1.p1 gnl/Spiro4/24517_TR12154_c0_g1~~gnl/Spiro4/24517_TR12154_c0_g1_i1.p1  ORF type:complete len:763 (+),score=251.36 gnl/Spiro4/24517_TR12154_c0_g1_i1:87-2375(+)